MSSLVTLSVTPAVASALASCAEIGAEGLEARQSVHRGVEGAIRILRGEERSLREIIAQYVDGLAQVRTATVVRHLFDKEQRRASGPIVANHLRYLGWRRIVTRSGHVFLPPETRQ